MNSSVTDLIPPSPVRNISIVASHVDFDNSYYYYYLIPHAVLSTTRCRAHIHPDFMVLLAPDTNYTEEYSA